jgi:hypothetical protein
MGLPCCLVPGEVESPIGLAGRLRLRGSALARGDSLAPSIEGESVVFGATRDLSEGTRLPSPSGVCQGSRISHSTRSSDVRTETHIRQSSRLRFSSRCRSLRRRRGRSSAAECRPTTDTQLGWSRLRWRCGRQELPRPALLSWRCALVSCLRFRLRLA